MSTDGVRITRQGFDVCLKTLQGRREYKARTLAMAERQQWRCALCGRWMNMDDVTFDHQFGRGMNGSKRDDRIEIKGKWHNAAAHLRCNQDKGSRMVPYVIEQPRAS